MSSVITVKDRFPWRKSQIRDVLIFAVLAFVGLIALAWSLATNGAGFPLPIAAAILGIGALVVIVSLIGNTLAKGNSTMFADLNTETYHVNFWMHKPTRAIWGDKLNRVRNQGDLTTLKQVNVQKVGKYTVLTFELENGVVLYLPDRLYTKTEVRDFLVKFVESRNGQVPAASKEAMTTFAGVLNEGRKLASGKAEDKKTNTAK